MECPKCGTTNDFGRNTCYNCEYRLRDDGESWFEIIAFWVFHAYSRALKSLASLPTLYRETRKGLAIPLRRCPLCGAQKKKSQPCILCGGGLSRPAISSHILIWMRVADWSPWIATLLSLLTLAFPTVIIVVALMTTLGPAISDLSAASLETNIIQTVLLTLLAPLIFLLFLLIYNFFVFTAKTYLLGGHANSRDLRESRSFLVKSAIHLALLALFGSTIRIEQGITFWYFWGGLAFTQGLIAISPLLISLAWGVCSVPFSRAVAEGFSTRMLSDFPVIGRSGANLDFAANLDEGRRQRGQIGEQLLAGSISAAVTGKGLLFNSLSVPGIMNADFDHVILIGNRVIVADAKNWSRGKYEISQGNVWRDGAPFEGGSIHLEDLRSALQSHLGPHALVDARVVVVNPDVQLASSRQLSNRSLLQLESEFLEELRNVAMESEKVPNAGILSDLIELSRSQDRPLTIEQSLSSEDKRLIIQGLREKSRT